MDFEWSWSWSALCRDVRRNFGCDSTSYGESEIWVHEAMTMRVAVEDSVVGPRLIVSVFHQVPSGSDEGLRRAASRVNGSDVGVRVTVHSGGMVEVSHGSMFSAYDGDTLLPIVRLLGDALAYVGEPEAQVTVLAGEAAMSSRGAASELAVYLAREVAEHGGTVEDAKDALGLFEAAGDVIPHPRAVPSIHFVTTDCPVAEVFVGSGGAAQAPRT